MRKPYRALAALTGVLWAAALLVLAQHAFAAGSATSGAMPASPALASLRVGIWPEFDRPAVLVILRGELAADTPLPAPVSLRIPSTAGRPSAVAAATSAESELFNLPHETAPAGKEVIVRFSAPQRFFHVEYYDDALFKDGALRNYTYVWRGGLAVGRLSVRLQTPAAATDLSALPALGPGEPGPDGLVYRAGDFGAHAADKQLVVTVRYTKSDPRTTSEILNLGQPVAPPPPAAAPASVSRLELALVIGGAFVAFMGLGLAVWWWTSRRTKTAAAGQAAAAGFCSKCGNALAAGDRFCSACGKPAGKAKRR